VYLARIETFWLGLWGTHDARVSVFRKALWDFEVSLILPLLLFLEQDLGSPECSFSHNSSPSLSLFEHKSNSIMASTQPNLAVELNPVKNYVLGDRLTRER
jgi:hypothetical protein